MAKSDDRKTGHEFEAFGGGRGQLSQGGSLPEATVDAIHRDKASRNSYKTYMYVVAVCESEAATGHFSRPSSSMGY